MQSTDAYMRSPQRSILSQEKPCTHVFFVVHLKITDSKCSKPTYSKDTESSLHYLRHICDTVIQIFRINKIDLF